MEICILQMKYFNCKQVIGYAASLIRYYSGHQGLDMRVFLNMSIDLQSSQLLLP